MSHQDVFSRISRRSQTQQKEILIVIRNYLTEKKLFQTSQFKYNFLLVRVKETLHLIISIQGNNLNNLTEYTSKKRKKKSS